jgi:phage shock protein A
LRFESCAKEERRRASDAGANAAAWERNGMLAVRAKDDDLARAALANKAHDLRLQSSFAYHADLPDREAAMLGELIETVRGLLPAGR